MEVKLRNRAVLIALVVVISVLGIICYPRQELSESSGCGKTSEIGFAWDSTCVAELT
jgi:hypothetical protein